MPIRNPPVPPLLAARGLLRATLKSVPQKSAKRSYVTGGGAAAAATGLHALSSLVSTRRRTRRCCCSVATRACATPVCVATSPATHSGAAPPSSFLRRLVERAGGYGGAYHGKAAVGAPEESERGRVGVREGCLVGGAGLASNGSSSCRPHARAASRRELHAAVGAEAPSALARTGGPASEAVGSALCVDACGGGGSSALVASCGEAGGGGVVGARGSTSDEGGSVSSPSS
jgi:hypothetical protein